MTEFTNVLTRQELDECLSDMDTYDTWVVDTETNSLEHYKHKSLISISIYFPDADRAYNLPFRHGTGQVEIAYTDSNNVQKSFHEMSWTGKTRKQLYLAYWFKQYSAGVDFENLPIECMEELKSHWARPGVTAIFHNARFDLHVLEHDGFPRFERVEDTMILLHTAHEDWSGIDVVAPYTYTKKENPELYGQWAVNAEGQLLTRSQMGRRGLKWQAALANLPGATMGEQGLYAARETFINNLAAYIQENIHNPYNDSIRYKTDSKQGTPEQTSRILAKLDIDAKANMWMLPSSETAAYAMLDVVLTWGLREHWLPVIKQWGNEELYEHQNAIAYELCWRMERNGIRLNIDNTRKEIAKVDERINIVSKDFDEALPDVNPFSPVQLRQALNEYLGLQLTSTDKDALEPLADEYVVSLVLELRKLKKARDTYLKRWLEARDYEGIIHPRMNADGTVAGRLSSGGGASGNFQNIPDRGGYTVKNALIPYDKNWVFFAIDYGQLEARLAAWIAEIVLPSQGAYTVKPTMTELFEAGEDLHTYTSNMADVRSVVYPNMTDEEICDKLGYNLDDTNKTPLQIVTEKCRFIGKTMNFGLIYSGGKHMLAKLLKIDEDVAAILVMKWRNLFPAFRMATNFYIAQGTKWRKLPNSTRRGQYITQPFSKRHRKFQRYAEHKVYYEDGKRQWFNTKEAATRKGFNNIVQGLGGYMCLDAGLEANRLSDDTVLRLFANIHDALDGFVHVDHMHITKGIMDIMVDWDVRPTLTVNLEGSLDGTWQNMAEVVNFDLWCLSRGVHGYGALVTEAVDGNGKPGYIHRMSGEVLEPTYETEEDAENAYHEYIDRRYYGLKTVQ